MQLFRIGPAKGPQRIGTARIAESVRASMAAQSPSPLTMTFWEMDLGQAELVRHLVLRWGNAKDGAEWVELSPVDVDALVRKATLDTDPAGLQDHGGPRLEAKNYARFMNHIRMEVFGGTTREMLGRIAGKSPATAARWEAGELLPTLDDLVRLRSYALALGLPWDDARALTPSTPERNVR